MGSSDTPPPHVPSFVVPASVVVLTIAFVFWSITYILMIRRSLDTKSYPMPLLSLACNLSWEIVYAFYVAEMPIEKFGFIVWLILDTGIVYTTVRFASLDWKNSSPWVAKYIGWLLATMTSIGVIGHYAFAAWWMSEPGRGYGNKTGKWRGGEEGYDTTELAYWSAGFAQILGSAGSLAMLVIRGHTGGTSYSIWFCRMAGSLLGMGICNGILWYWWHEAHGYFLNPLGMWICGVSLACDLAYPFMLHHVRALEMQLPGGQLVNAAQYAQTMARNGKKTP